MRLIAGNSLEYNVLTNTSNSIRVTTNHSKSKNHYNWTIRSQASSTIGDEGSTTIPKGSKIAIDTSNLKCLTLKIVINS